MNRKKRTPGKPDKPGKPVKPVKPDKPGKPDKTDPPFVNVVTLDNSVPGGWRYERKPTDAAAREH